MLKIRPEQLAALTQSVVRDFERRAAGQLAAAHGAVPDGFVAQEVARARAAGFELEDELLGYLETILALRTSEQLAEVRRLLDAAHVSTSTRLRLVRELTDGRR